MRSSGGNVKLVIVSNRLPVSVVQRDGAYEIREAVGGLATAVRSFLRAVEGGKALGLSEVVWVGWSGLRAEAETEEVRGRLREMGLVTVPLAGEEVNLFYEGFCNSTLWPLFHGLIVYTVFEGRFWDAYVRVNQKFAEVVLPLVEPGDIVWVHDYHLMLLPAIIRDAAPDAAVGFFLHIPFPPAEVFQLMPPPWRSAILDGVLGADLVGFHVHEYVNNFLRSVAKFLGYKAEAGAVYAGRRKVKVGAFPISIDFDFFYNSSLREDVAAMIKEFRQRLRGLKIVFSIDRLDYTKGNLNRLRAWERFLKENPEWRGKATFIMVVTPSRTGVPQYEAMKREIEREVGRINGELGEVDWTPVVYIYRFIPTPTLLALYNVADVALITPLRDGMNLVAKEYVASRRNCTGVLILSETAGAAHELLQALIVNPNDEGGVAAAIKRALTMSEEEQCRRIEAMQERIRQHDVVRWAVDFIHALAEAHLEAQEAAQPAAAPVDGKTAESIAAAFSAAARRLLLLDYDGTLVPHYPYAYQAVPDAELLALLRELAAHPETHVAVVSGRGKEFLEAWLGNLPIYIVAEHGAFIRHSDGNWVQIFPFDTEWKAAVRRVMEEFAELAPGSYVEEKQSSIAWHYRNVEPEVGEAIAARLIEALGGLLAGTTAAVLKGNKVVEVRPAGVNKGAAARLLVEKLNPDFVLAAGDDATDEDMFKALPPTAYTVKVGRGETAAKYYVPSYKRLRELLTRLSKSLRPTSPQP
ncbi:bifunctional alpha,alpha-trehalose-phosphate synthase (UDP-forming)/trehalose-phosphatase [Pyrobaculum calidifontis]|uniref:Alpha,alpha-trehalose-phosphate synthase n=1 Tax=Pyrobaculum calidifontis (strain DSM 21063 / JCM 11548 / VA1) TaxID=410359 RepID=A3MVW7_PYRCJ|nr:trehalose 6-phosphate synthase / trehalose 6-phosphatase [Pyrobaculum calidifontis JCM 11548]